MSKRTIAFTSQRPYALFGYPPAKRPCLFVTLSAGERKTVPFLALVDSGADRAQFPIHVATDFLGLHLDDLEQTTSFTAGGPAALYRALVTMHCDRISFLAEVRFNPQLSPTIAFLGCADIFSQFLIGLDQRGLTLLYTPYRPAPRLLR